METEKLYHQTDFEKIKSLNKLDIYSLGAHCFTGDHQKVRWMANQLENAEDLFSKAFVQFHLGLSYTRTSHYSRAKNCFKQNLKWAKEHPENGEIQFLAYQGLGFFNYFFSRHQQSLKACHIAQQSLQFQSEKKRPLFQVINLDLQGHNLVQRLRIHQGIQVLQKALHVANEYNVKAFRSSLNFSLLLYEAEFSDTPSEGITKLEKALENLPSSDDYSRSELVFLISNLLMLRGEFKRAQDFLSDHYRIVYETDNRRQMGRLNFRMTYNMFKQGSLEQALYLAKTARSNLSPRTDLGLMCKILGLEIKILDAMGVSSESSRSELATYNEKIDSLIISRSNARILGIPQVSNQGEDSRGDLVEDILTEKSPSLFLELIEKDMGGLLNDFFEVKPGEEAIVVNGPKNTTLFLSKEKNYVHKKALGTTLSKLLLAIAKGESSKEELIKKVWGYSPYDPERHDSLIYSSVGRLRSLLSLRERDIYFDGEAYRLNLKLIDFGKDKIQQNLEFKSPQESAPRVQNEKIVQLDENLNYRQAESINDEHFDGISVKIYADRFDITPMTALRDLKKLCELGYLKRFGKGRATRYMKVFSQQ